MITRPRIAHTLLAGFMLACLALPGGAAAQTPPPTKETGAFSAAMAEALRSPFHASGAAGAFTILGPVGVHAPLAGNQSAPDSANRPTFHRVFWPTLGAVFLSELAFVAGVMGCSGGVATESWACETGPLMGTAALVLGPPTVSRIAGGSFGKGLLGSAAGVGVGYALFRLGMAFGLDDSVAYWGLPSAHALLTTAFAIR